MPSAVKLGNAAATGLESGCARRLALMDHLDRIKSYSHLLESGMRSTQQFSVTLPNEMAAEVRAKVASGDYASESEVIREGLRALQARDRALETWLRQDVAAAYDAIKADPTRSRSSQDVRNALAAEHGRAVRKR